MSLYSIKMVSPSRTMEFQQASRAKANAEITKKFAKIDQSFGSNKPPPQRNAWSSMMSKSVTNNSKNFNYSKSRKKEDLISGRTINPTHQSFMKEEARRPQKKIKQST